MNINTRYNLGVRKLLPEFISNGKTVTLGTETVIRVGSGGTDYFSFGDIKQSLNGRIHLAYRQGLGHNSGNDGHIKYCYSDDGGSTFSSPVEVVTDGSGSFNTTNPALFVSSSGRILLFFAKQDLPTGLLTQQSYLIYSDDGGATWSSDGYDGSEIKVSNDIAYMNIIGSPIEMSGILMLPMYGRVSVTSGNEYCMIYQSSNDGATWTLRSNVTDGTAATVLNAGETSLLVRSDNSIFTNMRGNDGSAGNFSIWSRDGGLTWDQKPYRLGTTRSKNPMATSPSGTILLCARDNATEYTVYGYSTNGLQSATYARIDSRTGQHEYSGVLWDFVRSRFLIVYFVETGTPLSSPTDIIARIVTES